MRTQECDRAIERGLPVGSIQIELVLVFERRFVVIRVEERVDVDTQANKCVRKRFRLAGGQFVSIAAGDEGRGKADVTMFIVDICLTAGEFSKSLVPV